MKEYNAKKTREDRKIENYFSHVAEKQQHMAVEIIFQVADKEFWEKQKIQRKNVEYVYENILDYLQQYLPNFVVANAVVHYDEASPHMHVVGVPVGRGFKRGLSTSAGFTYSGERFEKWFGDFRQVHGFSDMYSGGFFPYKTLEEYWAYWSRYIYMQPGRMQFMPA